MSESKDIATTGTREMTESGQNNSANFLAMIVRATSDPTIDAGKMVTLAKLATDLQDRERQAEFSRDRVAALNEMPSVYKSRKSDKHEYAPWEDIHERVMPILRRHNITLSHNVGQADKMVTVEAVLTHANGLDLKGGALSLPIDTSGSKNNVQGVASTVAYGKRITGKAILNIIESNARPEDRDGAEANAPLADHEQALIDEAQRAALGGSAAYLEWFKGKDPAAKGWLVFGAHHERLKAEAAKIGA